MPFKDIDIFLRAAEAILQGRDPYSIPTLEAFYPLPFYFLFVPLVTLPPDAVHVLWTAMQAIVFVAILRRRALPAMLSMPVLLTFLLGQVDIVMMALFALLRTGIGAGVALAFLVLKPQLVLLLAPWQLWQWWRCNRRQFLWFVIIFGTIVLLSFAVQPDWVAQLLARSGERVRVGKSSSLWGLLSFLPTPLWLTSATSVAFILAVWAWRSKDFQIVATVGLFLSPFVFSYNLMPLLLFIRKARWLLGITVLTWMTFIISALQTNDRASALCTLLVLVVLYHQQQKMVRSLPSHTEGL